MDYVKYDFGFMFKYSQRPGTSACKKFDDNVPEKIKQKRLEEIKADKKDTFENLSVELNNLLEENVLQCYSGRQLV